MIGFFRYTFKVLLLLLLISGSGKIAFAQCPPNIDFEQGNFTGWECWIGHAYNIGGKNVISWDVPPVNTPVPPIPGRHTMLSAFPGDGLDPFGQFPQNCPNGSGHSIRLGNTTGNHEAEGASYTFTIPAGQNQFNIIFHYAVVFQGPVHQDYEQPRLVIDINDITDNTKITCSSFEFFYSVNGSLPGFFLSQNNPTGTPVWCKDWSATSIKLDGYAGKTIQLFFKTADCVFQQHFGYAYVDVNTECSSSFIGAVFCPDDAFINVTAPYGYETYKWWDAANPAIILGNTQTINFTPPPTPGTILKVAITPYAGYGCVDTLTAELLDTLTIQSDAGPDRLSCQNAPVQLGVNPRVGYVYSWSPRTGLSNPNISNPIASPSVTTEYVVTTTHEGGGCASTDTVLVKAAVIDNTIEQIGISTYCLGDPQAAILKVLPADSIQWYRNNVAIAGANQTLYNVVQTGTYHATLFSFTGCSLSTSDISITVNPVPVAGFTLNAADQCFNNNQFIITDTSSITAGTLFYNWDLGDGTTATTNNVNHSYLLPGTYTIKLIVTSDKGCVDSASYLVHVFDSPVAGFNVLQNEACLKNNSFEFFNSSTLAVGNMQYKWDFGDGGTTLATRNARHSYALPGTYTVTLLVTSDKGCTDDSSFIVTVNPEPVAGISLANPQQCFTNNQFNFINNSNILTGTLQYLWDLGDGTTATSTDVTHSYTQSGDYLVKLTATSDKNCVDSTTFTVKVYPYAIADFYVEPVCINLPLPLTNKTVNNTGINLNYLWDFGNGQGSTLRNPVYRYPAAGTYTISLSVNTNLCPQPLTVKQLSVVIDAPATGITYPEKDAIMNYPELLQARNIGSSAFWSPGTSLDQRYTYKPYFKGLNSQLYTIQLKTLTGCLTVDTQMVKVHKKIEIYVPTAFTPGNGDGINDYLRPTLMGFVKVNYFRVYNRWGKLLFQMQSDRPGWDGRENGQKAELQTVVWMIEAVDVDGNVHHRQGTTVLLH